MIAANGPVSLRAHTDALQLWADQSVTVISVNDEIRISAKRNIELVGGQSSMVLEGGNVTFSCPGIDATREFVLEGGARQIVIRPTDLEMSSMGQRQPTGWGYSNHGETVALVGVPTLTNNWREY